MSKPFSETKFYHLIEYHWDRNQEYKVGKYKTLNGAKRAMKKLINQYSEEEPDSEWKRLLSFYIIDDYGNQVHS